MTPGSRSRACLALVRAFCPGEAASLRECRSTEWQSLTFTGERIIIEYDLPDGASKLRANELASRAGDMEVALPGAILADVEAYVAGETFTVEALVVAE